MGAFVLSSIALYMFGIEQEIAHTLVCVWFSFILNVCLLSMATCSKGHVLYYAKRFGGGNQLCWDVTCCV
jgi:hypothetical protein